VGPVSRRLSIPDAGGAWRTIRLAEPRAWPEHPQPYRSRVAFAAAHVVADPFGENVPGAPAVLDWDATLAFRRHLFRYGFGVAEAMDTAQRNMGLDWSAVQELVRRSAAQASEHGARIASGAGTDHKDELSSVGEVIDAYLEQIDFVQSTGSQVILMASRHLARLAASADDYLRVYEVLLGQVTAPVILHWLGEAFDPELRGYWGASEVPVATKTFLELVGAHAGMVDGVKVSLLSAEHEVALRALLPDGVRLYTGDDFNYPELIGGDGTHHSDALLGAFAAVAAHLRRPHLLLQDRHRLHGLDLWAAARLHHGWGAPVGPLDRAPVEAVRPGQRGAAAARPRPGGPPAGPVAGRGRGQALRPWP
jgi:hypothetical protein